MKNQIALLVWAIATAALAWGIWYVLGNDTFTTLTTVALVVLTVDNIRLRNRLRATQSE